MPTREASDAELINTDRHRLAGRMGALSRRYLSVMLLSIVYVDVIRLLFSPRRGRFSSI